MFFLNKRPFNNLTEDKMLTGQGGIWNNNLQLIRGIAVILVVFSHFAQLPILGDYGVDLFFIISGYLISQILNHELRKTGKIEVRKFIFRRIRRLVPAAYLVIICIFGLSYFGSLPGLLTDYVKLGLGYSLYIGNVIGLLPGSEQTTAVGLGHFWTLATEMQLYITWGVITIPFITKLNFRVQSYILTTSLICVIPAIIFLTRDVSQTIVKRSLEVIAMFILGTLFYFLHQNFDFNRISILKLLIFSTLGISFLRLFSIIPENGVFDIYANLIMIGAAYQLIFTASIALWTKPLIAIGDISYSLYLIHWPVYLVIGGHDANLLKLVLGLVISFGLAMLSYRYVEMLFWKPKRK